jgi:RNA recognition motif-containing protein
MINIYVGNLSFNATESDLRSAFEAHGQVVRASVVTDRETGRSRGFGFVEMEDRNAGLKAIEALNGKMIAGREVKVNEAQPREQRSGGGGGGGGFGGGGGRRGGFGGGGGGRGGYGGGGYGR